MAMKTVDALDLKGKRAFIRVDFNVPLDPQGKVADDQRIRAALPPIQHVIGRGAKDLKEGQVLLLENLRFHPEEEKNDEGFARELAGLCDVWVNDAFGTAHRA